MSDFDPCCAVTLDYEGGNDNDPRDPGGRTSRGITQSEWNTYRRLHSQSVLVADVWRAPQAAIVDIYRTQYWNPVAGDQWPKGLDLCVYDAGVNSGPGRALAWARAALGQGQGSFVQLAAIATATPDKLAIIKRYQASRLSFLHALRTWAYFGKGWGRRVAGIEAIATKWALAASGVAPEVAREQIQVEAKKASQASNTAGSGAIVAPAAPAAASALTSVNWTAPKIILAVAIGIIIAAGVAYLAHRWYIHKARAQALQEASHGVA